MAKQEIKNNQKPQKGRDIPLPSSSQLFSSPGKINYDVLEKRLQQYEKNMNKTSHSNVRANKVIGKE